MSWLCMVKLGFSNIWNFLSIFVEFPTIRVFIGNKAASIIAVKIARFLLFQLLWQLWHKSWAKRHTYPRVSNRGPVTQRTGSLYDGNSQLLGQQHQQHQTAASKANTSSGHASHRVMFSGSSSDGSPGWFTKWYTVVWLWLWLWLLFVFTHILSPVPEISQWFYQMPYILSIACLEVS